VNIDCQGGRQEINARVLHCIYWPYMLPGQGASILSDETKDKTSRDDKDQTIRAVQRAVQTICCKAVQTMDMKQGER
jgi:hypothetical protein